MIGEMDQEFEWSEAQSIEISVDLVRTAKRQLQFLAAVDRNRFLYESPALERAIYRYNACWLPLLAKHLEFPMLSGPLVVPLDCEWIWHCHRLNPVQYESDCVQLYGRILDSCNVESSVQGIRTSETEEIWSRLYLEEPFSLSITQVLMGNKSEQISQLEKHTKYDLVSAVKRQSPFFYQVSRPHMDNDHFLKGAVARYKGFLYLIKRNKERCLKSFSVPTYDIDLIWHSHQLHPVAYCENLNKVLGKTLAHDDMDSDRTKGRKLDVGFSETTKHWEDTFGSRYWRAGAMYKGNSPSPVTTVPYASSTIAKDAIASSQFQKALQLPKAKAVEIMVEFVAVKNIPVGQKGNLFVTFSKSQPDILFNIKRKLTILSESGEKQVATFQCEATGELLFELFSHASSNLSMGKTCVSLGSASLSLQNVLSPVPQLSIEKWFELKPSSSNACSKPIDLRVAVSFTVPSSCPREFDLLPAQQALNCSCFPLLSRKMPRENCHIADEVGNKIISLQMRETKKENGKKNNIGKEVMGITKSGESHTLAVFMESGWSLMNSQCLLTLSEKCSDSDHLFELVGDRLVKFFRGRKLEYEPRSCHAKHNTDNSEKDFTTAVEFCNRYPYGRAVALYDFKHGYIKVREKWFIVPGITLAFILWSISKKRGYGRLAAGKDIVGVDNFKKVEGVSPATIARKGEVDAVKEEADDAVLAR